MRMCDYWWGTHGCDLSEGHEGHHRCLEGPYDQLCSEYDGVRVRFGGVGKWEETGGGRVRDIIGGSFIESLDIK